MSISVVYPEKCQIDTDIHSRADLKRLLPETYTNQAYDISLILPMYNVASYLKRCLDSVFGQINIKIQVIIINDGSTDDSLEVALEYFKARPSKNVIIIDQENKGPSTARNTGVRLALTDFVAFLDTDDFMAPNAYTTLFNFAKQHDLDLVFCRSRIFNSYDLTFDEFYDAHLWEAILKGNQTLITNSLRDPALLMLEPNTNMRLYRRVFFLKYALFFPEGFFFEDFPVHTKAVLNASKIGLVNAKLYNYRINRPGKTTEKKGLLRFDVLTVFDETLQVAGQFNLIPEQAACILYMLIRATFWCGTETLFNDRSEYFRQLSQKFKAVPLFWINAFELKFRNDISKLRLLWALHHGDTEYLIKLSMGYRQLFKTALFLIRKKRFGVVLSQIYFLMINRYRRSFTYRP